MGLGSKVFQKQGIHDALEAHIKLADVALRKGHDLHARKAQAFEYRGHVFLVA
jgi:hypothetical protein